MASGRSITLSVKSSNTGHTLSTRDRRDHRDFCRIRNGLPDIPQIGSVDSREPDLLFVFGQSGRASGGDSQLQGGAALQPAGESGLRGFGAFSARVRDERIGRNPRTGEEVAVSSKAAPYFKADKELRERLNLLD